VKAFRTLLLICAAALCVVLGLAAPAGAAPYQYQGATIAVSTTSVAPGGDVTVSGTGFTPNGKVTLTVRSTPVVYSDIPVDSAGKWSFTFAAPKEPGTHTATGTDGVNTVTTSFEVVAASGADSDGTEGLATTGSSRTRPMAQAALLMCAVGAMLVVGARKRSDRRAHSTSGS